MGSQAPICALGSGVAHSDDGTAIAYAVEGAGPPILLIMGYRLSADAWPPVFLKELAARFTIIKFDNRGTGQSNKPTRGYALANLARDAKAVLDHAGVSQTHVLGYSMGGAIAQDFVRQFPEKALTLTLCATMCGGAAATYSSSRVRRIMRNLDALPPLDAARRIWTVTYNDDYLRLHATEAERQLQCEIATPTPLHAADLQMQAFAEFDCSAALKSFRLPVLVMTGDRDVLIPPENSTLLASLIPGARQVVLRDVAHRLFWERPDKCLAAIDDFHAGIDGTRQFAAASWQGHSPDWTWFWPWATQIQDFNRSLRYGMFRYSGIGYGDGKPVILLAGDYMPRPFLSAHAHWLETVGYRAELAPHGQSVEELSQHVRDVSTKVGRKAVIVAFDTAASSAVAIAKSLAERVSDIVQIGALNAPASDTAARVHVLPMLSGWNFIALPKLLRTIEVELL